MAGRTGPKPPSPFVRATIRRHRALKRSATFCLPEKLLLEGVDPRASHLRSSSAEPAFVWLRQDLGCRTSKRLNVKQPWPARVGFSQLASGLCHALKADEVTVASENASPLLRALGKILRMDHFRFWHLHCVSYTAWSIGYVRYFTSFQTTANEPELAHFEHSQIQYSWERKGRPIGQTLRKGFGTMDTSADSAKTSSTHSGSMQYIHAAGLEIDVVLKTSRAPARHARLIHESRSTARVSSRHHDRDVTRLDWEMIPGPWGLWRRALVSYSRV